MNNLLELCKIFHCRINDLVNDNIIDIDLLGDEVKTKAVSLINKYDLVEILFLFSLSYIFEYGRLLGLEANGKMYVSN